MELYLYRRKGQRTEESRRSIETVCWARVIMMVIMFIYCESVRTGRKRMAVLMDQKSVWACSPKAIVGEDVDKLL